MKIKNKKEQDDIQQTETQVYLIGSGPGDPELLTLKAQRILGVVDVVLYDYLAHPNHLTAVNLG